MERVVDDKPTWFVETVNDIGARAGHAYEDYPEKVTFGNGTRKYRKHDLKSYNGVLHVACKAPRSQRVPDNGRNPRRPLTDILAVFDEKSTAMTYSDLVAMLGKADALADIEQYYKDRRLDYPWEEEPEEVLKVIKRKSNSPISSNKTKDQLDEP